jgi:hypothetical protein
MFTHLITAVACWATLFILKVTDSPVTSTDLSAGYQDLAIVKLAAESQIVDKQIATFLQDPNNPLDQKAAVIAALGWSIDGKNNATFFCQLAYNKDKVSDLNIKKLRPDQLAVIGYLLLIDDYFKPEKALPYLTAAAEKLPKSYTAAMLLAIGQGQKELHNMSNWCAVWQATEKVLLNKTLTDDILRPEAVKSITDYMISYKEYCK